MEKIKILYIEDDEKQRKKLSQLLRNRGYNVSTALNGEIGIEMYKKKAIDVILCDLNMPDISGLEVMKCLKQMLRISKSGEISMD